MATFSGATGQQIYRRVVHAAINEGVDRKARSRWTRDLGFTTIMLESPYDALPFHTGRNPKSAVGVAEALQLIGAFSMPSLLLKIAPRFKDYMDGDGFHGAYGSRIRGQLRAVKEKIEGDSGTRQAVITLWDRDLDNIDGMHDYPCTIALQFEIRAQLLCMNVIMRSNDVWLGLAYDMFQFTQLQFTLANALSLGVGWYRHTALSMHIYEDDIERARAIHDPTREATKTFQPLGLGGNGEDIGVIMRRARQIAGGKLDPDLPLTESERWYVDAVAPYVG